MSRRRSTVPAPAVPAKIRRREERRQRILSVAAQLFSERGYHGTSMRDLGEALRVHPGSLYAQIRSKGDVLYEIVDQMAELYERELDAVMASAAPPLDQLRDLARRHVRLVVEYGDAATVYAREWRYLEPRHRARVLARRRRYEKGVRGIIAACVAEGVFRPVDLSLASGAVLGQLTWTHEWYSLSGRLRPDELADWLVESAVQGLAAPPAPLPPAERPLARASRRQRRAS